MATVRPPSSWTRCTAATSRSGPPGGMREERAQRVLAAVEERSRRERCERALEGVLDRLRSEHHVRLVEVASETGGPTFEIGPSPPAGELLEEVLDQVLLRQALDQLDLLDADRSLVRDRTGEGDGGRALGDEQPEQLLARRRAARRRAAAAAPHELGTELREAEALRPVRVRGSRCHAHRAPRSRRRGGRGAQRSRPGGPELAPSRRAAGGRASRRRRSPRRARSALRARPPAAASRRTTARSRSPPRRATRSTRGTRRPAARTRAALPCGPR